MSALRSDLRVVLSRCGLIIGVIVCLGTALTAGYIWIMATPSIAPPGLRVLSWFWSVFVCHCSF